MVLHQQNTPSAAGATTGGGGERPLGAGNKLVVYFWFVMAVGNLLWTAIPHVLMMLKSDLPNQGRYYVNSTHYPPLSRLEHRPFPEESRVHLKESARRMFYWGYNNYMRHAFPADELDPIHCTGRGHDWAKPSNININDVLGDYSLTLIDSLDMLVVLGDIEEFKKAVRLVIDNVSFNACSTVQVFEATIRVLGSLLSAHLLITDPDEPFGSLAPEDYDSELLHMAHDLANRLIPAFENTTTGLPHPRVNLCHGVPPGSILEGCVAGIGTLTLEFSILSRLLGDPVYENLARRGVKILWDYRHPRTGLLGNVIQIINGQWVGTMAGVGAGLDSFYEYLLKSYIMYGEREDLEMFNEFYHSINKHIRKGHSCTELLRSGNVYDPPIYANVDYRDGKIANYWIDSLSASLPALQVLAGDINEAICNHAVHYTIWRKYSALPERFDFRSRSPVVSFYPLRPELVESTYFLYQATGNPFYLHVGYDLLNDLEQYTKERCGYATLHNVVTKEKEDRMESFFLSETCKYLYLLFDTDHTLNRHASDYLFTTEGHILKLDPTLRHKSWKEAAGHGRQCVKDNASIIRVNESLINHSCPSYDPVRKHSLPLSRQLLGEIEYIVGLYDNNNIKDASGDGFK